MANAKTQPAEIENLLTPDKVAQILNVTRGTLAVWRCTKRVALPYVKAGRAVGYRPADVRQFIEANTVTV